jgi:hypothetical protein
VVSEGGEEISAFLIGTAEVAFRPVPKKPTTLSDV